MRAWCRQRFGNDWHTADKAVRLAEARVALSAIGAAKSFGAVAPAQLVSAVQPVQSTTAKQASGSTKRSAPEAAAAKDPKRTTLDGTNPAAAAAKEPKRTLNDALTEPGSGEQYLALSRIQRTWNMLDCSGEMQMQMQGDSVATVPVYHDTRERKELLRLMKEVWKTGHSSYSNPFGADNTEGLLGAFAELTTEQQCRLHAIAKRCVGKGTAVFDDDVVEVLGAK